MINLCLVVIATQFSETKKRETERMLQERKRFNSSSTLASNSEPGGCYNEILKYVAHLWRRAKRKLNRLCRRATGRRQRKVTPERAISLRRKRKKKRKGAPPNTLQLQTLHPQQQQFHITNHPSNADNSSPKAPRASPEVSDIDPVSSPRRPNHLMVPGGGGVDGTGSVNPSSTESLHAVTYLTEERSSTNNNTTATNNSSSGHPYNHQQHQQDAHPLLKSHPSSPNHTPATTPLPPPPPGSSSPSPLSPNTSAAASPAGASAGGVLGTGGLVQHPGGPGSAAGSRSASVSRQTSFNSRSSSKDCPAPPPDVLLAHGARMPGGHLLPPADLDNNRLHPHTAEGRFTGFMMRNTSRGLTKRGNQPPPPPPKKK